MKQNNTLGTVINYIAIGDSYTIGQGVEENDRFPNVLVRDIQKNGITLKLISNPAVSGYTTQDALEQELPVLEGMDSHFVTVLLGANDSYRNVGVEVFKTNLSTLLDRIQVKLPIKNRIILLTIPDYSSSPAVKNGGGQEMFKNRIVEYNNVIKNEGQRRTLEVVDLFTLSKGFEGQQNMFVADGLHPSSLQYKEWEKEIFPVARKLFSK